MVMSKNNVGFDHLDRAGRLTAKAAYSPKAMTYAVLSLLCLAAWLVQFLMTQSVAEAVSMPGSAYFREFAGIDMPPLIERLLALCLTPANQPGETLLEFLTLTLMWFLMALAMMLPSAAPLIRTYCDIAETAKSSAKAVVHPLWLVAGYLLVWLVAAIIFAAAGWLAAKFGGAGTSLAPVPATASAAVLALAGLYQFSSLKEACLTKCRNPFTTLFANWSAERPAIIHLGIRQGLWCLGCCWALMLVMLAVGIMNIFWMLLLCIYTIIEKTGNRKILPRVAGILLLVWALAVLLFSI